MEVFFVTELNQAFHLQQMFKHTIWYIPTFLLSCTARQRGPKLIYARETATYTLLYIRQIPLKSVRVPICHSAWWHFKILSALTHLVSYKLKNWNAWRPTIKHSAFRLLIIRSFPPKYCYLFQVSSKAFLPVHTHWYIHLSLPTLPPLHSTQWVASSGSVERVL